MRRVLVFGANGMLGYAVRSYFAQRAYELTGLTRDQFDIATEWHDRIHDFVQSADIVINCAGIIKPMISQNSVEAVLRVNAIFPRNLALACLERGIPCFHVTTDCVYSGRKGHYTESDLFDPDDLYGMSKNAGESRECMVLRTSIIGEECGHGRSLLEWVRSQSGKEVRGFTNHRWNGVTTVYLAELIESIVQRGLYKRGVVHLYSPQSVTKCELLSVLNEVYGLNLTIVPASAEEIIDRTLSSEEDLSREIVTKSLSVQIREMRDLFAAVRAHEAAHTGSRRPVCE